MKTYLYNLTDHHPDGHVPIVTASRTGSTWAGGRTYGTMVRCSCGARVEGRQGMGGRISNASPSSTDGNAAAREWWRAHLRETIGTDRGPKDVPSSAACPGPTPEDPFTETIPRIQEAIAKAVNLEGGEEMDWGYGCLALAAYLDTLDAEAFSEVWANVDTFRERVQDWWADEADRHAEEAMERDRNPRGVPGYY